MRTKWDEVMDAQLGVAKVFTVEHAAKVVPFDKFDEEQKRDWAIVYHAGAQAITKAEPVFVEEEIIQLAQSASESFVPEPAHMADFFIPNGFMLLEVPMVLMPISPETRRPEAPLMANACLWDWRAEEGFITGMVSFFQHIRSDQQVAGQLDKIDPWHLQHPWSQVGYMGLQEGVVPTSKVDVDLKGGWEHLDESPGLKIFQTLIRLAQQPLTQKVDALAPRAARRRAMRAGQDFGRDITTITLRRAKRELHEDHEAKKANYSHRFIVHGFWRNQWFPSLKRHKQMWIHDFVKGDDSLPLVIKERRFDFRR